MEGFGNKIKNRLKDRNFWYTAIFLFLFSFLAFIGKNLALAATAPNIITYQGKLLVNGSAATTTQSMKIVLYDSLSGGTALYTASGTLPTTSTVSVTVSNGFFTVNLGDTGTNSLDPDIFKNNSSVYLEVTIGGETLTPRKRLTAATYAFNAKYLDGIGATSTPQNSAYIPVSDSSGNLNLNSVTSTALTVSGETNLTTTTLSTLNSVDVNGTTLNFINGSVLYLSSSGTASLTALSTVGNSTLATTTISSSTIGYLNVTNSTNIGGLLSVTGNASFGTIASGTWNGNAISNVYGGTGQNSSGWSGFVKVTAGVWATSTISVSDISNSSTLALLAGDQTFTGAKTFSATSTFATATFSGYVGIGTTTPQSGLHLYDKALLVDNPVSPILSGTTTLTAVGGSMYVSGNYLYAVNTGKFGIIDIRNKANPIVVSSSTLIEGGAITVSGKYAYVLGSATSTMSIIDVSNPYSPAVVSTLDGSSLMINPYGIYVSGKYAYISGIGSNSIVVVNISNPTNPQIVGSLVDATYLNAPVGVYVVGNYAYVAGRDGKSLTVVDVSNQHTPVITGFVSSSIMNGAISVYVSGKYAYVAAAFSSSVLAIDISNPASPTVVGSIVDGTNLSVPTAIQVSGKYAYVASGGFNFAVVDISNPASLRLIGNYNNNDIVQTLAVSGNYAYLGGQFGNFSIVNLKGADISAAEIGNLSVNALTITENVDIGNNLYIRNGLNIGQGGLLSNGALAISVSSTISTNTIFSAGTNTTSSILAVNADGTVTIKSLTVTGNSSLATTTISSSTIGYLNVTNNTGIGGTLSVIGNASFGTITSGTWNGNAISNVYGGTGQDSSGWSGVAVINGGTWSASSTLSLTYGGTGTSTFASGGVVFSDGSKLTQDTSNFYWNNSTKRLGLGTSTPSSKLQVYGGSLSVNDPTSPTLLSTTSTIDIVDSGISDKNIKIVGKYAYMAGSGTFMVYDVSNRLSPTLVGSVTSTVLNDTYSLRVSGKYVYVMGEVSYPNYYLVAIDISNPSSPSIVSSLNDANFGFSLEVYGKYAYVGDIGSGLSVVDISNPYSLVVINHITAGSNKLDQPRHLSVSGGYLYVGNYNAFSPKFTVVDIKDPVNPVALGAVSLASAPITSNIYVSGKYAYYLDNNVGSTFNIVDISNPNSPSVVGQLTDNSNLNNASGVEIAGNYAYVVGGQGFVYGIFSVVDISDPSNPVLKNTSNSLSSSGRPYTLDVVGKYAYAAGQCNGSGGCLYILDLNGANISSADIGDISTNGLTVWEDQDVGRNLNIRNNLSVGGGIFSNGSISVVASSTNILENIFNVGTNSSSSILTVRGDGSVVAVTSSAFLVNPSGNVGIGTSTPQQKLHVYDGTLLVDSPVNPTLAGATAFASSPGVNSVYVSGKYGYVLTGNGLATVNIDDKTNPTPVGYLSIGGAANAREKSLAVAGKYAYITASASNTLNIVDVSNPKSPTLVYALSDNGFLTGVDSVFVSGKYAYVAANGTSTVSVVDVSNSNNPRVVGYVTDATKFNDVRGIYQSGRYLYITGRGNNYLTVVDVSSPSVPTIVGSVTNGTSLNGATSVYVSGNYAYVSSFFSDSIATVDVSDPTAPTVAGYLVDNTNLDDARSVFVSGKYAYVASYGGSKLAVVDISNTSTPRLVGSYSNATYTQGANGVFVSGKYAYVASVVSQKLAIIDLKGADISSADIGNVSSNNLTVWESLEVGNSLNVRNSLNIGSGGLMMNGDFAMSGATTNTLNFSTTTVFSTSIPSSSANAFIFDAINTPTSSSQTLLSVRAGGTPVFSVSADGNVQTIGILRAASATVSTPGTPGDLAERVDISLDDSVEPGDVIVVDPNSIDTYRRSTGAYSQSVAGVISTNPTITVGDGKTQNTAVMAMVGRVPIKVTNENGPIKKGDILVTASTKGFAMKYDVEKDEGNKVIGVVGLALEDMMSGNEGKIMGLVRTGWVSNNTKALFDVKQNLQQLAMASGVALYPNNNLSIQTSNNGNLIYNGGDLTLQGNQLLNVASIKGKNNKWLIDEQGRFITRFSTSQGDKDMYAIQSPNSEFVFSSSSQMTSGEVKIVFDQYVQEVIDQQMPIKINITLTSGEAKGIYVSEKSAQGFTVKELDNGQSNATFDWMVVATRKQEDQQPVQTLDFGNIQNNDVGGIPVLDLNNSSSTNNASSSEPAVSSGSGVSQEVPPNSEPAPSASGEVILETPPTTQTPASVQQSSVSVPEPTPVVEQAAPANTPAPSESSPSAPAPVSADPAPTP